MSSSSSSSWSRSLPRRLSAALLGRGGEGGETSLGLREGQEEEEEEEEEEDAKTTFP